MLMEGIKGEEAEEAAELSAGALFMQGSRHQHRRAVGGFTISEYGWFNGAGLLLIVAIVTFFICEAGLAIGKKFGTKLSGKAPSSAASSSSASVWRSSSPASWAEKNSSAPAHLCRGAFFYVRGEAPAEAGRKFAVFYCILPQNRGF